jgi:tRNA A37 threonylcarbamoyladenosine synthetase subunit TsaC/SUA5/YrdC
LLLQELDEALFSSTLILPNETDALTDPYDIREKLEHDVDLIIDAGVIECELTTIIEFSAGNAEITRQGKGIAQMLQ